MIIVALALFKGNTMKNNPCEGCPSQGYKKEARTLDNFMCTAIYSATNTKVIDGFYKYFRDHYCPCKECLVKVVCKDKYSYNKPNKPSCELFTKELHKAVDEYKDHVVLFYHQMKDELGTQEYEQK